MFNSKLVGKICGPFALLLMLLTVNCSESEVTPPMDGVGPRYLYDYELALPATFKRQDVSGIDSKVEEWRSPETIISTDLGPYSSPPDCAAGSASCSVMEERIGGRAALVGRNTLGATARSNDSAAMSASLHVHLPIDETQRLRLNLFARCTTTNACDEALGYFRRVRILKKIEPVRPATTTVRPPVPPPQAPLGKT